MTEQRARSRSLREVWRRAVSLRAFFVYLSPFLLVTRIKWLRIEMKVKLSIFKIWGKNRYKDFNDDNNEIAKFLLPFFEIY